MTNIKQNTAVITTKDIICKKKKIVLVFHDNKDGMWEFLDGQDVSIEQSAVVSIEEIIQLDSSVEELLDLPLGFGAFRNSVDQPWQWFKME